MERLIHTRQDLLKHLKEILAIECLARDSYDRDLHLFSNQRLTVDIKAIKLDEEKHIHLLESLIKMLEKPR